MAIKYNVTFSAACNQASDSGKVEKQSNHGAGLAPV